MVVVMVRLEELRDSPDGARISELTELAKTRIDELLLESLPKISTALKEVRNLTISARSLLKAAPKAQEPARHFFRSLPQLYKKALDFRTSLSRGNPAAADGHSLQNFVETHSEALRCFGELFGDLFRAAAAQVRQQQKNQQQQNPSSLPHSQTQLANEDSFVGGSDSDEADDSELAAD